MAVIAADRGADEELIGLLQPKLNHVCMTSLAGAEHRQDRGDGVTFSRRQTEMAAASHPPPETA